MANFRAGKLAKKEEWPFSEHSSNEQNEKLLRLSQNKSLVIALMMLKCHFSLRVKVKLRYRGDVLSRGRAWFTFCFLPNEVGDPSFFRHNFIILLLLFVL